MKTISMVYANRYEIRANVEGADNSLMVAGVKSELHRKLCNVVTKTLGWDEVPHARRDNEDFDPETADVIAKVGQATFPEWGITVHEHVPSETFNAEMAAENRAEKVAELVKIGLSEDQAEAAVAALARAHGAKIRAARAAKK